MPDGRRGLCLVTGGAGFIGSHTVDALCRSGYPVRIIDSLHPRIHPRGRPSYLPKDLEFIVGDVSRREDLDRALQGVSYVFHFAAYQDYLTDFSRFFHVNAESTALLFELVVEKGYPVEKVVVASSQAVYGEGQYHCDKDGTVYPEPREESRLRRGEWAAVCPICAGEVRWQPTGEAIVNPQNSYGMSKYTEELIALRLGRRYGIPAVALRYSIVQGPRQSFHNAYSGACRIFCLGLHLGQRPVLYEDGQQIRDYVNIHDVVAANMLILERPDTAYQTFNVGGGRGYSVAEFFRIVEGAFGGRVQPDVPGLFRFGDTRHIVSDISRLQSLGWTPRYPAEDSVREYVSWLREQDNVEDVLAQATLHMRQMNVVRSTIQ